MTFVVRTIGALVWTVLVACTSSGERPAPPNGREDGKSGDTSPLDLVPGFQSAMRMGITTGATPRANCNGFFPREHNFLLRLQDTFTGLTVSVDGPGQVSLAIAYGASLMCGEGTPSTVRRDSWLAGEYQILVGTASHDVDAGFTVTVTE